jgi:hypothetical protein
MTANRFVVTARSDGRGGFRPFGTFRASEAGTPVTIGDKSYVVGADGRVNIPKSVMNKYGVSGADGRKRVTIQFASHFEDGDLVSIGAVVSGVHIDYANAATGEIETKPDLNAEVIYPADVGEYNWSV